MLSCMMPYSGAAILITGIIIDDARGLHGDHRQYSDLETDVLNAIPITALHRNVDISIIEADKAGYVRAYIITPGIIFLNITSMQ